MPKIICKNINKTVCYLNTPRLTADNVGEQSPLFKQKQAKNQQSFAAIPKNMPYPQHAMTQITPTLINALPQLVLP